MLEPIRWGHKQHPQQVHLRLRYTDDLPHALCRRMGQLAAIQSCLAGYCHAVSIMLQIPGGAAYRFVQGEQTDFHQYIWRRDPAWPITVLTEALTVAEAINLMPTMFLGRATYRLSARASGRLAGLSRNSLLNVVAECLDRLLIVPFWNDEANTMDVDGPPEPDWWDRLNARLRAANLPKREASTRRRGRSGKR